MTLAPQHPPKAYKETLSADVNRIMSEAESWQQIMGLVGVPHYVFFDHTIDRHVGLFGREHLALIRSKLSAQGLTRNESVRSEFSRAWTGP